MENLPGPDEKELTILEYLKSLLNRGTQQAAGDSSVTASLTETSTQFPPAEDGSTAGKRFPWFTAAAAALALTAQLFVNSRVALFGLAFYLAAGVCLFLGQRDLEWTLPLRAGANEAWQFFTGRTWLLIPGVLFAVSAFLFFSSQRFTLVTAVLWTAGIIATLAGLWNTYEKRSSARQSMTERVQNWLVADRAWFLAVLFVVLAVLWFSFTHLKDVPPELVSGQVDHIYTVRDILMGNAALTHSRNLVSEPLQYLWSALISYLTGNPPAFAWLKLGYALANLTALYFVYRLAAELFDRWVGLAAAFLLGISFWQIIQTRALLGSGLVLPLGAASLSYLFSGLQKHRSNDLLLSSLFAGLGLLTNKLFLIFPLAGLVISLVWLLSGKETGKNRAFWAHILQAVLVGAVVIVPLLRAVAVDPRAYLAPILSRVSGYENALSGSPLLIFLSNLWSALGIANWSNRSSWVDGLTLRPALDAVSAAFFVLGICSAVIARRKLKDWRLAALLVLYPLLLLPSAMSLAFPLENPSLSRALGALIPIIVLAAVGFRAVGAALFRATSQTQKPGFKVLLSGAVLLFAMSLNYQAAFVDYPAAYRQNAWNASEMAKVIKQTEQNTGFLQNAWVVGYPYWVDARAVALEADRADQVLALMPDQLEQTANVPGSKLFLVHPLDASSVEKLQQLYPMGTFAMFASSIPEKDFLVFQVEP